MNSIVVHYKELALKGKNRPWFIERLVRNLRVALGDLGVRSVRSVMGRIEIDLPPLTESGTACAGVSADQASPRWEALRERIQCVFGIANFSLAPGQPARPSTDTPIRGLLLAGDWIDTGLPATIESAVRSGHRAAEMIR